MVMVMAVLLLLLLLRKTASTHDAATTTLNTRKMQGVGRACNTYLGARPNVRKPPPQRIQMTRRPQAGHCQPPPPKPPRATHPVEVGRCVGREV